MQSAGQLRIVWQQVMMVVVEKSAALNLSRFSREDAGLTFKVIWSSKLAGGDEIVTSW